MPRFRLHPVGSLLLAFGFSVIAAGCERSAPAVQADSVTSVVASLPDSATSSAGSSGWNERAGVALLVQGENRDEAIVLLPAESDTSPLLRLPASPVVLLGRGGAEFTAILGAGPTASDTECRVWPLRNVSNASGASAWAVGFVGGVVTPIALDSVDILSSRDSLALAAEASRLASAVTVESAPSFQGLRFTAHDIRRFEVSPGVHAITAHVMRKVNQEANPQEEQTLLIAERDSGVATGPYHLAYAERTHGLEEQSVTPEVIAAVRILGRTTLVVARDGNDGVTYTLMERVGARRWRVRWTSAGTRCA